MIAHLNAMKELVSSLGFDVWLIDASGAKRWPRVTIAPGYGRPGVDRPLSDDRADLDEDIRVTCAGLTPQQVVALAGRVRALLSPGHGVRPLEVPGRRASVKFLRHEMTNVDRDIADTATGRHPIYTVETFHLLSIPEEG